MEKKSISKKLVEIQSALKAPKSQRNTHGGYTYRSCEDILEALKPLLKEQGVILIISDDIIEIGGRIYVKAKAEISDGENSINTTAFAREIEDKLNKEGRPMMDQAQITGSASSYARKYALNGLFCIDDTKDADATNTHGNEQKKPIPQKPAPIPAFPISNYGNQGFKDFLKKEKTAGKTLPQCLFDISKKYTLNPQDKINITEIFNTL